MCTLIRGAARNFLPVLAYLAIFLVLSFMNWMSIYIYIRKKEYQPSGEGGNRSPPAISKMAHGGPQNSRRSLERDPAIGYLEPLKSNMAARGNPTFAKLVFDLRSRSMGKGCDRE